MYQRLIKYISLIVVICGFFYSCKQPHIKTAKILLIHSYAQTEPFYVDFNAAIEKSLKKNGIDSDMRYFYLDCEALNDSREKTALYQLLEKHKAWNPDIILVNDDQAAYSILKCGHPILKLKPIVFAGVNFPDWKSIETYKNVTGIWDKPDYLENVRFIKQLMGDMRITINFDQTALGILSYETIVDQLKNTEITLNFNKLAQWGRNIDYYKIFSVDSALLEKEALNQHVRPATTIVSFAPFRDVKGGHVLSELGGTRRYSTFLNTRCDYTSVAMGRVYNFPAFTAIYESFGYSKGFLGGYFTSMHIQAEEQSALAARVLWGENISDIPVTESRKEYLIDWKEVQQWHLDINSMPNNIHIVNMPYYERNKVFLTITFSLITIIIIVIISYLSYLYLHELKQRRLVQSNLRKEKESLSLALEGGNIFVWRFENGKFIFDNDFFTSLGLIPEPILPSTFATFIHPDERERFKKQIMLFENGFVEKRTEQHRCNFNGRGYQWWEFRHGAMEKNIVLNGLCLNVQQTKNIEQNLIAAREKAEESDRLKSAFLANMSHEIRTPLNAIVGFSNLLTIDDELLREERLEYIDIINKNCVLLLKLINDILDLSRIESGRMSFNFEECNLTELINEIYGTQQLMMPQGVVLLKEVPEISLYMLIDKLRLNQVITNFVNNAVKFTTSGYIKIGYEYFEAEEVIHVYVEDTGIGIPEEKHKSVFERFNKLDEFAQGTGLGLAICQVIIQRFEGSIRLTSTQGKGSRFTISLPYKDVKMVSKDVLAENVKSITNSSESN